MNQTQELAKEIAKELQKGSSIDEETHKKHHAFLDEAIQELARKRLFWGKVKQQTVGWGIIVVLGGIGKGIWHLVEHFKP